MLVTALLVAAAHAQDPPDTEDPTWWVGLPLAGVQFAAPEGGLPDENLEPLLRAEQGLPLNSEQVRLDLTTLFRVGEFSAVEADVQPWVVYDDQGEPQAGALLTYVVYPAPTLAKVSVEGNRDVRDREVLDSAGLSAGQVFYGDLDTRDTEREVTAWLIRQGYTDAGVQLRTTEPEPGRVYVVILVEEGPAETVHQLTFSGNLEGVASERQLRRWARRAGVREGHVLPRGAIGDAQERVRRELGRVQPGIFRKKRGWIGARVTPAAIRFESGTRVTYHVEPGPQLDLEVTGLRWYGERKVRSALDIDHRLRLTRGFLDEAPDQVEGALQRAGWLDADVTVALQAPSDDIEVLAVEVGRGSRYGLGRRPDLFDYVDMRFTFEGPMDRRDQNREESALQAVFDQASPDVIRRDIYTEDALADGTAAARDTYRNRGHLDAALVREPPETEIRRSLANAWRSMIGRPPAMRIVPHVRVTAGQMTRQSALSVTGSAESVDIAFVADDIAARVGAPYSPQAVEQLARRVVAAHRQAGYLEAETRTHHVASDLLLRESTIEVLPGPQILLRATVTRGASLTHTAFLRREADLERGQPVGIESLERLRANLYDLGIVRTVELKLLGDGAARDLLIDVDERARWAFEAGGGLNTDQGVRLFGRATRRNLWGRAHRLQFLGQIGLDYRSEDLRDWVPDVANPEWRAAISYTAPRFPIRASELVLDVVLRDRRQERTWRMDRTGGGAALQIERRHALNEQRSRYALTRVRTGLRLETRQLNEIDPGALITGEPWITILEEDPTRWRVQEALTGLVVLDRRDDPLLPSAGTLISMNAEWAPGLPWDTIRFQPRTAFIKGEAKFSGYAPLFGFVLHLTARGGYGMSYGDGPIPLEDRFRLGGTGSLRGYVRDAVGPQNIGPPIDVDWPTGIGPVVDYVARNTPNRWVPTGGDTTFLTTLELLMPLPALGLKDWDGYAGALFADVGQVWLVDPGVVTTSQQDPWRDDVPLLRVGVGAGVRAATPIGPLQLDLGINPQALTADGTQRDLLVAGWEEPVFRAHLSLGATF